MREPNRSAAVDALRDYNFEVQAFREAAADHFGIGIREGQAAANLVTHGELSAGDLSRLLNLTPATVTNLLARLDRAGLATTTSDPADLRRIVVRPTERAEAMIVEIRGWLDGCFDRFETSGIPLDVVCQVVTLLREELHSLRMSLRPADDTTDRPGATGARAGS